MTNIFIIHWSYGCPEENWFPWLKTELEKLWHKVYVPKFPTPENQTLENWKEIFENYKKHINKDTIFVGHSLWPVFLLDILEKENTNIKAYFSIAGFISLLWDPIFDEVNKTFVDRTFDWEKIKNNCEKFHIYYSDNDPYISEEKAEELAKNLEVKPMKINNAGHFNEKAGYTKFELLLDEIKKYLG